MLDMVVTFQLGSNRVSAYLYIYNVLHIHPTTNRSIVKSINIASHITLFLESKKIIPGQFNVVLESSFPESPTLFLFTPIYVHMIICRQNHFDQRKETGDHDRT